MTNLCLHDGWRLYKREKSWERDWKNQSAPYEKTEEWCKECGAFLRISRHDLITNEIQTTYENALCNVLYTRRGRLAIVREWLREHDIDIPAHWRDPGQEVDREELAAAFDMR